MTSSPHSRTNTELAAVVEKALRDFMPDGWDQVDPGYDGEILSGSLSALAELRSRAEQHDYVLDCKFKETHRANNAERERDHMRAALEQIPHFDSPEIRHWIGSQDVADVPTHIAQIAALTHAAIRARTGLSQPGNTQP